MFPITPQVDFRLTAFLALLCGVAVVLLTYGWFLRRSGREQKHQRLRKVALGATALLAFLAAFGFFVWELPAGIKVYDAYHYYLNSKYFPELGYFDLYTCTVTELAKEPGSARAFRIRDLRNPRHRMVVDTGLVADRCNGSFSPERWKQFQADLGWFRDKISRREWGRHVLNDHGYNASPVWTLIGRPIASIFPAEDRSMRLLRRIDLVLILASLAFVGWAFGFEVLCIATLVWAANPLTRYTWIGDAFLRYPWFASSIIGICLLKKERYLGAGAVLALSSLLRLFPAFFIAGYAVAGIRHWLRERTFGRGFRDFAIGAVATSILLPALAIPVSGRGPGVLAEFAQNITAFAHVRPDNSVGIRPLLSHTSQKLEPEFAGDSKRHKQELKDEAFSSRRVYYVAVLAVFLLLLWRAFGTALDWEAAALGFALILTLTSLPAYYAGCMVAPALLAGRRPGIGIGLLLAMAASGLATLYYWSRPLQWVMLSAFLLLVSLYIVIEAGTPRRRGMAGVLGS